jgi:hypothetical protein
MLLAADAAAAWLADDHTTMQLAAIGCNPQKLLAALQQLQQVVRAAAVGAAAVPHRDTDNCDAAAALAVEGAAGIDATASAELCKQLQAIGQLLAALAFLSACNNPGCANVSGPSEADLIWGKSCICAGCVSARYCGKACQKQHWKQHKPVCKALAAAAAATSAAHGSASAPLLQTPGS